MADEYSYAKESKNYNIPKGCEWSILKKYDVSVISYEYQNILDTLANTGGMIKRFSPMLKIKSAMRKN